MEDTPSTTEYAKVGRKVSTRLWQHHAEMCSEHDWAVISKAVEEDKPLTDDIVEPVGEAKDAILASLLILYWTMKVVQLGLQISKEVSGLRGRDRTKAIVDAVAKRMNPDTPKIVSDRVSEIVDNLGLT